LKIDNRRTTHRFDGKNHSSQQKTEQLHQLARRANQKQQGQTLTQSLLPNPQSLFYLCPMYILLLSIVIGLFVAMLFVNLYFRAKVFKVYGFLVRNKVEFGAAHIFNRQKLEEEILPKYPQFRNEIESFIRHMKYSIKMATVLIALITAFGAILMYYR